MTLRRMLRPALVSLAVFGGGLTTASCGQVEADGGRFEGLAQHVADIRIDSTPDPSRLKVEVMDPHDLWDARDGGLRGAIHHVSTRTAETVAPVVAGAVAPVVAEAVIQRASTRIMAGAPMRPAIDRTPEASVMPRAVPAVLPAVARAAPAAEARTTIQLGAYSSPAAARTAWADLSGGRANAALKGLSPTFEVVEVKGRPLTRLRVAAPESSAAAICQAVAVADPWCARRA